MNSRFTNPEINKKMYSEKLFQNDILFSRFYISKISLLTELLFGKHPKTIKVNFGILKECRGAGRKM